MTEKEASAVVMFLLGQYFSPKPPTTPEAMSKLVDKVRPEHDALTKEQRMKLAQAIPAQERERYIRAAKEAGLI
jgi:hypothetical protein